MAPVVTTGAATTADLKLRKTTNLESDVNADWILSAPGTDAQKPVWPILGCHTAARVRPYHTADDWKNNVLPRMANYTFSSFWLKPQAFRLRAAGFFAPDLGSYLATINLSAGPRPLVLPRLKGASTHVIVTSYDLPVLDAAARCDRHAGRNDLVPPISASNFSAS